MVHTAKFDDEGNLVYAQFHFGARCITVKQGQGEAFLRDEKDGRIKANQSMRDVYSALEEAGKRTGHTPQQLLEIAAEASEVVPVTVPVLQGRLRKVSAKTKQEMPLRREKPTESTGSTDIDLSPLTLANEPEAVASLVIEPTAPPEDVPAPVAAPEPEKPKKKAAKK